MVTETGYRDEMKDAEAPAERRQTTLQGVLNATKLDTPRADTTIERSWRILRNAQNVRSMADKAARFIELAERNPEVAEMIELARQL